MKLSFSLPSSKSSAHRNSKPSQSFGDAPAAEDVASGSKPQFIVEFDSSNAPKEAPKLVVPPLESTWRAAKKMRNIDIPLSEPSGPSRLQFEAEDPAAAAAESDISYGLNLRSSENGDQKQPEAAPAHKSIEHKMLEKVRQDLKDMPDDPGFEQFEALPVEDFGAAVLAGYGWSEGKGIGRRNVKDVPVVQFLRRAYREGLGFEPSVDDVRKQRGKSGRDAAPVLVAPKGPDGRTRHVVGIDEKLVPRELKGIVEGKVVRVVGGRHAGLKGRVMDNIDKHSSKSVVVLKLVSKEEVSVGLDEVAELGSVEEERFLRKMKELNNQGKNSSNTSNGEKKDEQEERKKTKAGRSSGEDRRRDASHEKEERKKDKRKRGRERRGGEERGNQAPLTWLRSHIRVRVISKSFRGGKLYLKKGQVMDVVGPRTCDISMDETKELVQSVDQEMLETALPKRGGPVLVLFGKHKGVFGILVERDLDKETGVVRDADSQELLNVRLEQVAEYIGDPSYLGY